MNDDSRLDLSDYPEPETEIIDKLLLELSQFSTAKTKQEIETYSENVCLKEELRKTKNGIMEIGTYIAHCLFLSSQPGESCPQGMAIVNKIKDILEEATL